MLEKLLSSPSIKNSYKHISAFDFDNTLFLGNCSFEFGRYLYRKKQLPFFKMLGCVSYYLAHRIGYFSLEQLHYSIFSLLFKGMDQACLQEHVAEYVNITLPHKLYLPMLHQLEEAKADGHYTIILSSSPYFLINAFADKLGVHEHKSSQYHIDATNRLSSIGSVLNASDKASYLKNLINELNIDPSQTTAYSDSHLDFAFLKSAGKAIAVRPNKRLRSIANSMNWEIFSPK